MNSLSDTDSFDGAALTEPKDLGWLLDAPTSDRLAKLHFDIATPISSKV